MGVGTEQRNRRAPDPGSRGYLDGEMKLYGMIQSLFCREIKSRAISRRLEADFIRHSTALWLLLPRPPCAAFCRQICYNICMEDDPSYKFFGTQWSHEVIYSRLLPSSSVVVGVLVYRSFVYMIAALVLMQFYESEPHEPEFCHFATQTPLLSRNKINHYCRSSSACDKYVSMWCAKQPNTCSSARASVCVC